MPGPIKERDELLRRIAAEYLETESWTGKAEMSPRLREAMGKVPREKFVEAASIESAYANIPLPIGFGQTISQPFIVAIMTDLLELTPQSKVLEIGTGSGYQAAVLAEMAGEVFTIETIAELARAAERKLKEQGYTSVHVRTGDGSLGWPEEAPFDAIIATAAASEIPPALIAQLKPGGRMVIPVGPAFGSQDLMVVTKDAGGETHQRAVLPVAFVPFVRRKPKKGGGGD